MNIIKRIFRCGIAIFVMFMVFGTFGTKIHLALSANHIYSQWWFWLLICALAFMAYRWIMQGSNNNSSTSHNRGRDYGREYSDCNKAWQLIHKNGWTTDDFTEAQQLLNDGHLRWTNNGDYIRELNKKIAQESLKVR